MAQGRTRFFRVRVNRTRLARGDLSVAIIRMNYEFPEAPRPQNMPSIAAAIVALALYVAFYTLVI